jgi:peptidoglycan pentaglycine glycine transferase (the first glycine)
MLTPALEEFTDRIAWEEFVAGQPHATFLQSWPWGDFQEALHRKVRRLARVKDGRLVAAALMVVTRRKVASFAYVPYGPVLDWTDGPLAIDVLRELRAAAKGDGVHYLRLDPHIPASAAVESILREAGFRRAVNYVQAEAVWVLDLEGKKESELLKAMRTTTRQLIRNADKLGVTIESTTEAARLPEFLELLRLTGSRQSFVPQEFDYLRLQFEMLAKAGLSRLYLASHDGETRAGAIVTTYGDNAGYVHGASRPTKLPTSTALQWAAIKDALAASKKLYDFWGVFPEDHPNVPLRGVSFFKKGFGGRWVQLAGAWDHPFDRARYSAVRAIETYRKKRRHL